MSHTESAGWRSNHATTTASGFVRINSNRVLALDEMAAATAAQLAADRQRSGRPVDLRDTLLAGIAQARRATIATRITRHFEGLDVPVVDPWKP